MDKRFIKYLWALPLLGVLSSCSESSLDEGSQNANNEIKFAVSTSKQSNSGTKSRAAIVDNDAVRVAGSTFGLFAYSHAGNWGNTPSTEPNFMNDQEVKYDNGSWTYSPLKFWTTDNISFFGYWPMMDNVTRQPDAQGVQKSTAKAEANSMPHVEFTQKMTAADMVDFIASHEMNKKRGDGVVTLDFHHVLTRLNFKARLDRDLTANTASAATHIFVTDLKVCGTDGYVNPADVTGPLLSNDDSKFYKTATFVLGDGGNDGDGHWVYEASQDPDIDIKAATKQSDALEVSPILATGDNNQTVTTPGGTQIYNKKAVKLNDSGAETDLLSQVTGTTKQNYLFLIPPVGKTGIQSEKDVMVELEYDLVTVDESLSSKGSVQHYRYAVSLPNGTLQQGKAYNIIFTVGMNPVEVDVNVSDWDQSETPKNAPSAKADSNDKADILTAWYALNTTKVQDKTANYFVINVETAPDALLNLRTTADAGQLKAFEMGDQVELLFKNVDGQSTKYDKGVWVPDGWYYEVREVNNVERYVMIKMANYVTVKAAGSQKTNIQDALTSLNTQKDDPANANIHYFAVDVDGEAPLAANLDLSTVDFSAILDKFTSPKDYIYINFDSENSASGGAAQTYNAPDGWEIKPANSQHPDGKYLLKRLNTDGTTATSIAIGNVTLKDGGTIPVNH